LDTIKSFDEVLYTVNARNFEDIALRLFKFQVANNPVYHEFVLHLRRTEVNSVEEIPFLPISLFKTHLIQTGTWSPQTVFTSSGTTGQTASRHPVRSLEEYWQHAEKVFRHFFGALEDYHVLALLPSYLEREGSSLVSMADYFIRKSQSAASGFYLDNHASLVETLQTLRTSKKKVILLGVTFALLDLADRYALDLSHCLIMETGGMKGKRPELTRQEVHTYLCARFNVPTVYSEYGMTELLTQAYSIGKGRFFTPPAMKILIRDLDDPLDWRPAGRTGGVNVIDLANFNSCAFIATEDLGKINQDGSFEVLGRMDNSDIRGCNLLVE
jgi:hypothetical protein